MQKMNDHSTKNQRHSDLHLTDAAGDFHFDMLLLHGKLKDEMASWSNLLFHSLNLPFHFPAICLGIRESQLAVPNENSLARGNIKEKLYYIASTKKIQYLKFWSLISNYQNFKIIFSIISTDQFQKYF